jgi:hypothetical protein
VNGGIKGYLRMHVVFFGCPIASEVIRIEDVFGNGLPVFRELSFRGIRIGGGHGKRTFFGHLEARNLSFGSGKGS